jgi:hypothetical protein
LEIEQNFIILKCVVFWAESKGKKRIFKFWKITCEKREKPIFGVQNPPKLPFRMGRYVCCRTHENRSRLTPAYQISSKLDNFYESYRAHGHLYIYIYTNWNEWCFWHLGTSKRKNNMVPNLTLFMRPTVIATSLWEIR